MNKHISKALLMAGVGILSLALVPSCVKSDNSIPCTSTTESPVAKVEGADTALVNQADTLTLTFLITSSCGKSATVTPTVATQTTNVRVMTSYEGCVCTQLASFVNQKYVFKSPTAGDYTLSFWGGGDTTIITKKIHVQ